LHRVDNTVPQDAGHRCQLLDIEPAGMRSLVDAAMYVVAAFRQDGACGVCSGVRDTERVESLNNQNAQGAS
jgi:hypothetical protein